MMHYILQQPQNLGYSYKNCYDIPSTIFNKWVGIQGQHFWTACQLLCVHTWL